MQDDHVAAPRRLDNSTCVRNRAGCASLLPARPAAAAGAAAQRCLSHVICALAALLCYAARADETNIVVTHYTNTAPNGTQTVVTQVRTNIVSEWELLQQGKVLWGAAAGDSIEAFFNRAEFQHNHGYCQLALALYKEIERRFSPEDLQRFRRDGCSGAFLVDAGLCRAYRLHGWGPGGTNYVLARFHGTRAVARMRDGSGGGNARRLALVLWDLSQLPEEQPGEGQALRERAAELYPGLRPEMVNLREGLAKGLQARGDVRGAANALAALLTACPYYQAITYAACGRAFALCGEYRQAFAWWLRGLHNMQPIEFHSCAQDIPREVYEWFAFATEEEVRAYQEAVRRVAGRFPALTRNVAEIAQWLQFANDTRVQFELEVRAAEAAHDAVMLTNLWLRAAGVFGNPWYAQRAGDYAAWTRIWCSRMHGEPWPYLQRTAEPCAAERIEQYLDKLPPESIQLYRDTLRQRAERFRGHENASVRNWVVRFDARCNELDQMLAAAPADNADGKGLR